MKTIITGNDKSFLDFREFKRFSGLFRYLSLRDVMVRYKQTWIGFGWSVIRPLINIVIFGCLSLLLDQTGNVRDKFISVSAGIVFWQLLSSSINDVSNSLLSNSNILTKVYFPKLLLPLSSILVCLIDFFIAFVLFLLAYLFLIGLPDWHLILLPLVVAYGLVFSFALGLIFATASVKYRDVKFILPFIIQILFYASPVFLTSTFILQHDLPEFIKIIYQLNPFVFILNSFKFCIDGHFDTFSLNYFFASFGISLLTLFIAIRYFLNFEKSFTDYI